MRLHGGDAACIRALTLLAGLCVMRPAAAVHFDCSSDDVRGEVQDASGFICASKCAADTFNCPTDVPVGTTAQPQCMLQDVDRGPFCALLCQVDSQCPNGARCRQMKQVGLCLFPVSFTDWARQTTNRKFNVGWPTRAGAPAGSGTSSSFQIAKTFAALQSLKSKYSIDDGDADMLILKELLSSMTASTAVSATPANGVSLAGTMAGSSPARVGGGSVLGAYRHDISNFENYMSDGVPGIERELHDTMWNVEHIYRRNVASELMRGILMITVAYISIGSFFKYQTGARGIEMIPHISFWAEYPAMVNDGVKYSKILLGLESGGSSDFLSGGMPHGGAGAFETL